MPSYPLTVEDITSEYEPNIFLTKVKGIAAASSTNNKSAELCILGQSVGSTY